MDVNDGDGKHKPTEMENITQAVSAQRETEF